MKAAIISLGSKSSSMASDSMRKYFEVVDDIKLKNIEASLENGEIKVLYEGKPFPKYDCIYAKGSFRYATLLRALTNHFYETTYMPIAPDAFTIGHDKILTHLALLKQKVPQPKTYISSSPTAAKDILNKVNYPIVFKFPHGTQGKGVVFADSFASASSLMDALETLKQPFLIQEYIDTSGVDIRAIVVGDKVVAAMKRKAVVGEARANIHAGGKGESFAPDFMINKIAVNTAEIIGAEICAVDILESPKGPVVIEVNLSPGFQGITAATDMDVADKLAKYLFKKTSERFESGKKEKETKVMEEIGLQMSNVPKQIITHLDFRGERILMPKLITSLSQLKETDEVVISATKGNFSVKRFSKKKD